DTLLHFDGMRYRMLAWVVMPNHVHTLFQTIGDWKMGSVVSSWKSWTGKHIRESLITGGHVATKDDKPSCHSTERLSQGRSRVWHREFWDRFIRDERHFA